MNKVYKYGPFVFLGILIFAILVFISNLSNNYFIGLAPAQSAIAFPVSCSDNDVKIFWDQVFVESSDGIIVIADDGFSNGWDWELCTNFTAYKISGSNIYFIRGSLNPKYSYIAVEGSVTQEFLSSVSSQGLGVIGVSPGAFIVASSNLLNRGNELTTIVQADAEYRNVFKISPAVAFAFVPGSYDDNSYLSEETRDVSGLPVKFSSIIGSSKNYAYLYVGDLSDCDTSFSEVESECINNEKTFSYDDASSCIPVLFAPLEKKETCSVGQSSEEIYKIVGNFTKFIETYPTFNVLINGTLINPLENYTSDIRNFKVVDSGKLLLEFDYNFGSKGNLSIDNVEIIKNSNSSIFGYTIVNGLEVEKEISVDRLANGNSVCVKDAVINSISEISPSCTGTNEVILDCPGVLGGYSCVVNPTSFTVSGLMHSGIREIETSQVPNSDQQLQTDTSHVGCVSTWSCTKWSNCIEGNKTRICTGTSSCGDNTNKPSETQSCGSKSGLILIIIFVSIFFFLIIVSIIVFLIIKNNNDNYKQNTQIVMQTNKNTPPRFNLRGV